MENTHKTSVARDVFLYLLVVGTLVASATSFGSLLFDFVNRYLPDVANPVCTYDGCAAAIRWAVSMLVIAFPVLVLTWRFIRRDLKAHPEKIDLRVRRWLLYLTLFVAGVVIIGDLVALIYNWLGGELTLQFILKIAVVFFIAGSTFSYFLRELHAPAGSKQGNIAWVAMAAVLVALIVGFWTAGSPSHARDVRLDERRINDLANIQNQIVNVYWTGKGRLPATLEDLRDPVSGFVPPTDPQTNEAYEYTVTGVRAFKLCATFTTESLSGGPNVRTPYAPYGMQGTWDHGTGRTCFDREIDPQLYPVKRP